MTRCAVFLGAAGEWLASCNGVLLPGRWASCEAAVAHVRRVIGACDLVTHHHHPRGHNAGCYE